MGGFLEKNKLAKRSKMRVKNNLGIIEYDLGKKEKSDKRLYRDPKLHLYDRYYDRTQYDDLKDWDEALSCEGEGKIPLKQRKPRINPGFAKMLCSRVASKLLGSKVFPKFTIEGSPEDSEYIRFLIKNSGIRSALMEPMRRMLNSGSVFVRFYIEGQAFRVEHYLSKYCYPRFDDAGVLEFVRIQYVYETKETNDKGETICRWFRMDLGREQEVVYDNPEYDEDEDPVFKAVDVVEHGMGFVQGEWMNTIDGVDPVDGPSLYCDVLDFFDEMAYSLSQSSVAVGYNQDPQLVLNKIDSDEMEELIRSASKAWNLGREGQANFLESDLNGVKVAMEWRDRIKNGIQDVARVLMLDPEKIVGSAQSAKAMEVLHGPLVDLIDEFRPIVERHLKSLILKMALANLVYGAVNQVAPIIVPPGYMPQSLELTTAWPPVFQQTLEDLQKKVALTVSATSSNLISRETGTRFLAEDFGIEDIEEEKAKIDAQPIINPFGAF